MTPQAAAEEAFKRIDEIFAQYPIDVPQIFDRAEGAGRLSESRTRGFLPTHQRARLGAPPR